MVRFKVHLPDDSPRSASDILAALACGRSGCPCVRSRDRGFGNTHCPAHEDGHPSLTVAERDGRVLVHCKYGCPQTSVIEALGALSLWPDGPLGGADGVKRYPYITTDGEIVAYHCRRDTPDGKQMWWEDADGRVSSGRVQMAALPLYGLPDLLSNPQYTVLVLEGEKAADIATAHGYIAVSAAGGAAQTDFGNAFAALTGRTVVLWPDADDAGVHLMRRIGTGLRGIAKEVRWLVVPDAAPKDDAADYFGRGGDAVELERLIRAAPAFEPEGNQTAGQRLWHWQELQRAFFPPPRWLLDGILPEVGLTILSGKPKVGKSWLALQIAGAVGAGDEVLSRKAVRAKVLYFCIEDRKERTKNRAQQQGMPSNADVTFAEYLGPLDGDGMAELIRLCDEIQPQLVVIDTFAAAKSGKIDENAAGPMADLANSIQRLAHDRRLVILLVAHQRKGLAESPVESLRGSSAFAAAADMILGLGTKPPAHILEVQGRDTEDATYRMEFDEYRWKLKGSEREMARAELNREVLEALSRLGESDAGEVSREIGWSRPTTMRRLKDLEFQREVVSDVHHGAHGVRVTYHVATEKERPSFGPET